jgi:hypothetical protein
MNALLPEVASIRLRETGEELVLEVAVSAEVDLS